MIDHAIESAATSAEERKFTPRTSTYIPDFDILRTDDRIILQGDVPGLDPDDLDVRFEDGNLTLAGKIEPRQTEKKMIRQEYGIGNYQRDFSIGEDIDVEAITATLRDGVVTIELPVAAIAKPRRIEIQSA